LRNSLNLILIGIVLSVLLDGCGSNPSPETTSATLTPTIESLLAATKTPIPKVKTFIVSSSEDSGSGSLRQALQDALQGDTISFNPAIFPPDAPVTINVVKPLPELNQGNLTIDASNAGVILNGSAMTDIGNGFSISSNGNTIRGLQIVSFPDAGIGISGGAQHNVIGGDRNLGDGPLGQGNLVSGNGNFGIGLWGEGTSKNTIQGNYIGINLEASVVWGHSRDGIHSNGASENLITDNVIGGNDTGVYLCCSTEGMNVVKNNIIGTDPTRTIPLGNRTAGVLVDRSNYNVIGPDNLIAYNDGPGVMFWEETSGNTVTENLIHDNGGQPSGFSISSQSSMPPPVIIDFNLEKGSLSGIACPNCIVEIFSDSGDAGEIYEGQTEADQNGAFKVLKGSAFKGPFLTATATDSNGTTSGFSKPTTGTQRQMTLQAGNSSSITLFKTKPSSALADNRVGGSFTRMGSSIPGSAWNPENYASSLKIITDLGLKRIDTVYGELEPPIDWNISEYEIPVEFDKFIDDLISNEVAVNYMLHYWDKADYSQGIELTTPRFTSEDQIQDYLDYVRFIVRYFKGRIQYYTIWSEPDNCSTPAIKCVQPLDYIELAKRTIPVIREEDPEAKVVLAPVVLFFARDYLFDLLRSEVISQFDVISWHPLYDVAPDIAFFGNYYYEYPSIVESIKQTASANGFKGEYWGTELTWRVEGVSNVAENQPWKGHTGIQSAKYWARGIVMELGIDVAVGLGGPSPDSEPAAYQIVQNVNTLMAGAHPTNLDAEVNAEANTIMSYGFSLNNGSRLFALWTNGAALDDDVGVLSTVTLPGFSNWSASGVDILNGLEQKLITSNDDDKLIIYNLVIKDYPIFIRLSKLN
jgi:hypothetical protein